VETEQVNNLLTDRNPALADPEVRRVYEEEVLFGEATDTLEGLVSSIGISRKDLAERLDVSPARVSQILNGGENLTLKSLAAMGWALGIRFELKPQPLADRRGTPACDDPPPPAWLRDLGRHSTVSFGRVEMPGAERVERWTPMVMGRREAV
jgi:transcriptional regulator with XRE-family HTH domain